MNGRSSRSWHRRERWRDRPGSRKEGIIRASLRWTVVRGHEQGIAIGPTAPISQHRAYSNVMEPSGLVRRRFKAASVRNQADKERQCLRRLPVVWDCGARQRTAFITSRSAKAVPAGGIETAHFRHLRVDLPRRGWVRPVKQRQLIYRIDFMAPDRIGSAALRRKLHKPSCTIRTDENWTGYARQELESRVHVEAIESRRRRARASPSGSSGADGGQAR
jgi:hypothetical protein